MSKSEVLVLGDIINPISDKKAMLYKNGALLLRIKKVEGKEILIIKAIGPAQKLTKLTKGDVEVRDFTGQVIIPPFFDMHFHWVQDAVRTMPKANLLKWLEKYTFPAEAKFADKNFAKKEAKKFFDRLVRCGTLGGACYSSIHAPALEYAMKYAHGDFVIGNVLMTINSPDYLTQTKSAALKLVKRFSEKYKTKYALTPRFAIATDPETMLESGKIAKKDKSFIQSHLSETNHEIDFVL